MSKALYDLFPSDYQKGILLKCVIVLLEAIIQIASLKCPDRTHLPLPMTSSAPELVPLITVLPPSRVHYRLSTSHSTHILTQFVTSRSNRVYKDNHFFFIV